LTAHAKRQDALIRSLNDALHPNVFEWIGRNWRQSVPMIALGAVLGIVVAK
jgi:hypothetical protein